MAIRPKTAKGATAAAAIAYQFYLKGVVSPIKNWLTNNRHAWYQWMAAVAKDVAAEIHPAVTESQFLLKNFGAPIAEALGAEFSAFASTALTGASTGLAGKGLSTPDNAVATAGDAFAQAFGFGLASFGTTAAFEMLLPEKLNTLNGVGPVLAKLAGFDEVAKEVLKPLYENAFGRSLDYHYRSIFKPELPDEADAIQWNSRRLLKPGQLQAIFNYSGLKTEYEEAFIASAYRSVQPRAVMALLQDVEFPEAQMTDLLQFAGLRDQDIALLLPMMKLNATKNVRFQYLSALKRSVELGTDTMAHLDAAMNTMQFSDDAKFWVQEEVNERKIQQLAELYRKSVSESYKYGTITDAQYVPALEAIGVDAADAQAHYALDSIAKSGKIAAALLKAEERLAAAHTRAAMQAAIAQFRAGQLDAAALEAALLAAGVDPTVAGFAVVVQEARQAGAKVLIYGLELSRPDALLLREKVAALKEQAIKKLSQPPAWLATLAALGIPDANAQALVSEWQAQANKSVLPI